MKKIVLSALVAAAFAATGGVARATGPGTLPTTWHVHDCITATCMFPHAPVGFFPQILGLSDNITAYRSDAARCPDATDKAFLGGGAPGPSGSLNGNQPLREGVCMTSTTIIHLKSIAAGHPAPNGWTYLSTTNGFATYYQLTPA